MNLLQILPRVPPATCGVGDYAWRVARSLRDSHGIQSQFLSAGTTWVQPEAEPEFPVFRLNDLRFEGFAHALSELAIQPDAILLQVSPYGYQKRGVPWVLAQSLRRLTKSTGHPPIMAMFHELFASGPPNTSAFWLQPLQKLILRKIAQISTVRFTNREQYARWLDARSTGRKTLTSPVFSNLGESSHPAPLFDRDPAMVMFVSSNQSELPLSQIINKAANLAVKMGLSSLHLVGNSSEISLGPPGVELIRHGFLEVEDASRLLATCRMAYTAYSPDHLGKSGLMAAFAAHGIAVITRGLQPYLPDGLRDGIEVFHEAGLSARPAPELSELQAVASNLHAWYQPHSLSNTAKSYADQLREITGPQKP